MNTPNKVVLVLNFLLAGALTAVVWHRACLMPETPRAAEADPIAAITADRPSPQLVSYSDLQSRDDWRQWIDQLRALGVPTPVLARLAQAGFEDRWRKKQAQTQAAYMKGDIDTDGLAAVNIQHDRDEENEMRDALGDADFRRYDMQIVLRSLPLRDVMLTPSESELLYEIEKKLQHLAQAVNEKRFKGEIDQTECDTRLQKAQAEHDEQVKALLGEIRYLAIFPAPNEAAEELRKSLQLVEMPTEVSFEALLSIQNRWNERRSDVQARFQEAKTQSANCEDELRRVSGMWETEFDRVLGTNALNTAQKANDPRYRVLKRYGDEGLLDSTAMDYVYRTIKYYESATETYHQHIRTIAAGGETVDWDVAKNNVQQFGLQTRQALQSYLGPSRFNQLWLDNLFPFAPYDPDAPK